MAKAPVVRSGAEYFDLESPPDRARFAEPVLALMPELRLQITPHHTPQFAAPTAAKVATCCLVQRLFATTVQGAIAGAGHAGLDWHLSIARSGPASGCRSTI